MIPQLETRRVAREQGVPETTVERDYAQNWLLKGLVSPKMVLKGGTAIRKVFVAGYRFSDDLDYTLADEILADDLHKELEHAAKDAADASGIRFYDEILIEENENGFEARVKFDIYGGRTNPINIKLDITKPEKEHIVSSPVHLDIIHPYSDKLLFKVQVYALEELLAEKVRSLFQRTRPRDLYDVWYFREKLGNPDLKRLFNKKCRFFSIIPDISLVEKRREDFNNSWENSLKHQMVSLPDFNTVFIDVVNRVGKLIIPLTR